MMSRTFAALALFAAMPVVAHHSGAMFDSEKTITISGTITELLVENGKPVQFGQPLFRVR
mgnify:CR=1 FL=1